MILLSGGFDPLHLGHVRMIQAAKAYGRVVIALNSDNWLIRKKGYVFQRWEERAEILRAIVDRVERVDDSDGTVTEAIWRLKPDYFGNGGDRTYGNPKEHEVCVRLGVREIFGLGGDKVQSSSSLVERLKHRNGF